MMVGNGLGVEFEHVSEEKIEPIVAQREVVTKYLKVAPGQVAGVHQTIEGRGTLGRRSVQCRFPICRRLLQCRLAIRRLPRRDPCLRSGGLS